MKSFGRVLIAFLLIAILGFGIQLSDQLGPASSNLCRPDGTRIPGGALVQGAMSKNIVQCKDIK